MSYIAPRSAEPWQHAALNTLAQREGVSILTWFDVC